MAVDELSIPGSSGIASVLRVWYFNAADQVFNNTTGLYETWSDGNYANYQVGAPASATPIAEDGTTARYKLTRPVGVITPGSFEWHKVVGGTPSTDPQVGSGSLDDASVTVQGGTPLPSTRRLYFRLKVAGVYTDPTGNVVYLRDPTLTFGVKRQDTGAIVVGVSPLQTYVRESVGSYYYEIAETGLALLYGAEYTDPSTATVVRQLLLSTAPPAQAHYADEADIDSELGKANADIWADLDNSLSTTDIAAKLEDSLVAADRWVNRELREAGVVIPLTSNGNADDYSYSLGQINDAARKYAAGTLLNKREGQSRKANEKTNGDVLKEQAEQILDELIEVGVPGMTTSTTGGDLDLNDVGMVTAGASVTPDGLPKLPRCSYGYYDRLYGGWVYR